MTEVSKLIQVTGDAARQRPRCLPPRPLSPDPKHLHRQAGEQRAVEFCFTLGDGEVERCGYVDHCLEIDLVERRHLAYLRTVEQFEAIGSLDKHRPHQPVTAAAAIEIGLHLAPRLYRGAVRQTVLE